MFISIKKRTIILALAIILGIGALSVAIGVSSARANAAPKNGITIVVDAGHGGIDGGVTGISTGTKESDINLAVSKSLRHFLVKAGYKVVMTRNNGDGLYGMATSKRKIKDMETRRKIIEEARPDLVISVHQNAYPLRSEYGAQVFYAPTSEDGKAIADTMQNTLSLNLNTKRTARPGDYFMLQCTEFPSILIECGFLSNPQEEKMLLSATYQEKVAYSIFTGVQTIFFPKPDEK